MDFAGCFALTCGRCRGTFCAWCLEWCGNDAHPHVTRCAAKPDGADVFYGSVEQFEASNHRRRTRELRQFLATLPPATRQAVLARVAGDLRDLGLQA